MKKRKETIIGLSILFVGFFLGLIIAVFVVENNFPSKASNDGWLGFLGGLFGSIISGLVAYFVLQENRNETLKIQEEQKKQTEYQIRKQFVDDIAETIAAYIADICEYCHSYYIYSKNPNSNQEKKDRRIAVEKYYVLRIKLRGINEAHTLLLRLGKVHNRSFDTDSLERMSRFEALVDELEKEASEFVQDYPLKVD